jgi:hypothetical protein
LPVDRDSAGGRPVVTPTRLLIGQILIVFAIVLLGVWAASLLSEFPDHQLKE